MCNSGEKFQFRQEEVVAKDGPFTTLWLNKKQNYTNYASNHPKKAGIAYFDKHVQPSKDSCVGSVLTNVFDVLFSLICTESGKLKVYGDILA